MSVLCQKSTCLIFLTMCLPLLVSGLEEMKAEETTTISNNETVTEPPKTNSTKDLVASETADPKKIDIVKQIRRLNEDGSYTVGYEAGDGTFKIESRDVQGNIKGTFGYVDQDGEIKRVSYSTSNTTQPSAITPILQVSRFNRTGSSTTRRPQPTLIYPKTSSNPTRATVIQAIPRRRPVSSTSHAPIVTTTESYRMVTGNNLNLNSTDNSESKVKQFPIFTRTSTDTKPVQVDSESPSVEPKIYRPIGHSRISAELNNTVLTTTPSYLRSTLLYEKTSERSKEAPKVSRPNTFRRQLSPTNYENEQMYAFQQSAGDDTTDVYGGSISVGTPRPLFTTTTLRPRLVPIHSILAARQKLNEKLATNSPQVHEDQQESTLEATTNKINDENYVTTNPIPVIQYPVSADNLDQRVIERPFLNRPDGIPIAQFRTRDFLRDNPGAAIPIGNQRVLFRYNPTVQVDENGQYVRQQVPPGIPQAHLIQVPANRQHVQNINIPQNLNIDNKQNLVSIPVHPGQLQGRYRAFNIYNQERDNNIIPQSQRGPPQLGDFRPIAAPVSTKDLKLLLHQLLMRQNRLQALMDIREEFSAPGPPYQNQPYPQQGPRLFEPDFRQKPVYGGRSAYPAQFQEPQGRQTYNEYLRPNPYTQNNFQYQQQGYQNQNQFPARNEYRQEEGGFRNEITNFDPAVPYESQRFVPRRRYYRPRIFDPRYEETAASNAAADDQVEYLPPEVREALLLKMLMLAIHPDFSPMPPEMHPVLTTPAPEFRKKVRNVQILGEETETKETEARRKDRMMKLQSEM